MASITFVPRPTPIKIDAQDAESKTFQGFEQDNKDIIEWLNTSMKKLNADEGIAKKTIVKIKSKVLPLKSHSQPHISPSCLTNTKIGYS